MITKVYAIMDSKAGVFNVPFFFLHDGQAVRAFSDLCNDLNTTIGRHPGDFSLYCLGLLNDANGLFDQSMGVEHLINGAGLVARPGTGDAQ